MKKFFLAILSVLLIASLSGCDGGTSTDKLLNTLAENSWFCDDDNSMYLGFNAEKKTVEQTIAQTSFYLEGQIMDIRQTGENAYEIDLFHEARHDEEMDYDEYTETLKIEYDIKDPEHLTVSFENGTYLLHSDKGLGEDKLLQLLEANSPYADYENSSIALFDAKAKTLTERRISNYETPVDEAYPIKSVVYKGFNEYDITIEAEGQTVVIPIHFEESEPDYFFVNIENPTFYETDRGMDAAQLINHLVSADSYQDQYQEITVIFDNSMGFIRINNSNIDNVLHEYGILEVDYRGCNFYRYKVEDMDSGATYDLWIHLHAYDLNIGMIFKPAEIIDITMYAVN
ncbi:MAG: hypothetical protein K6A14_05880 [Erysipelotrichaceae bacterium]|nr:hypothetical protein [Erysipelotrichaceae bacterium]